MTMKTRSVSPAPIWNPTLPPSTMTVEGALQPLSVRQTTTPLPYFAPTMNPARFRLGITPTHSAFPSRSSGMPLSLASRISLSTSPDTLIRFCGSPAPKTHKTPSAETNIKFPKYFIAVLSLLPPNHAFLILSSKVNESKCYDAPPGKKIHVRKGDRAPFSAPSAFPVAQASGFEIAQG